MVEVVAVYQLLVLGPDVAFQWNITIKSTAWYHSLEELKTRIHKFVMVLWLTTYISFD